MKKNNICREDEIRTLLEIIDNYEEYKENSEHGLSILLNGAWGIGKTTFLKAIDNELNKNNEVLAYYNAFESDYYDNAYIPVFAKIESKFENKEHINKLIKSISNVGIKSIMQFAFSILKQLAKNKTGLDLDNIENTIKNINDDYNKNTQYLQDYKEFVEIKEEVKDELRKICKNNENPDKKYIFIIDELDRCNPKFAIETLEIVKHFFDIENCIFIIAVDKIQLEESAKTIFGQNMNSEIYFSKFFDYQFNMPKLSFYELVNCDEIRNLYQIIKYAEKLFSELSISTRDSIKIFGEFCKANSNWTDLQSKSMLFLFTLKYTDLLLYNIILNGKFKYYTDSTFNHKYEIVLNLSDIKEFCLNLSKSINLEYFKGKVLKPDLNKKDLNFKGNQAYDILSKYIPFKLEGLTYKQTIEKIIN